MKEEGRIPKKQIEYKKIIAIVLLFAGVAVLSFLARLGIDHLEKTHPGSTYNTLPSTEESAEPSDNNDNNKSVDSYASWANGNWFRGDGYERVKVVSFVKEQPRSKNILEEWTFDGIQMFHINGKASTGISNPLKKLIGEKDNTKDDEDEAVDTVLIIVPEKIVVHGKFNAAFQGMTELESVTGLEMIDTSAVTNMNRLFADTSIQQIDIKDLETDSVTDISRMFQNCKKLTGVDFSGNKLSNVKDMSYIFNNCERLSSVVFSEAVRPQNISHSFDGTICTTDAALNISGGFVSSDVTDMSFAFADSAVDSKFIESLDVGNVENMNGALKRYGHSDNLNLSKWNAKKVKTMDEFFAGNEFCEKVIINGWSVPNLVSCRDMFNGCYNLRHLEMQWTDVARGVATDDMFEICDSLPDNAKTSIAKMFDKQ